MNTENFDFAIAGSSMFAAVLALALARQHRVPVSLIGRFPAPLQNTCDIALSPGPYSRPETLQLLNTAADELRAFLPATMFERRAVTFTARHTDGHAAASHVRHMLAAFDVITGLLPESTGLDGFIAEGVWTLNPHAFCADLPMQLAQAGVQHFEEVESLQVGRDIARFAANNSFFSANKLIITDASAAHCLASLPKTIAHSWRTALLAEPMPELAGQLIVDVETGGYIVGHADGRLEIVAPSETETDAGIWLGSFLPPGTSARIIARKRFPVLLSRDGAPLVTPVSRKAAMLAIGFGASAGFFALALARHLVGIDRPEEVNWFAARGSGSARAGAAEIGLVGGGTA